jgi:hypothetical protein
MSNSSREAVVLLALLASIIALDCRALFAVTDALEGTIAD